MDPADRLGEALKQLEIVREDARLTMVEEEWLDEAGKTLLALQAILERDQEVDHGDE